jgi:UDP-2,3-diacylglucosamine pyrophosphatase LpxH
MALTTTFRHASVSDVHTFHPETPTKHILVNLTKAFPDNELTGELDAIFIVGDFFDQIAVVPDPNVSLVKAWIVRLLRMCATRKIALFVLEGTPKHDRGQNKLFTEMATLAEIPVELYYITELTIFHWDKFGVDILFIPDEWSSGQWSSNTAETQREVKALMAQKNLDKVDFSFIHGAMDYHLKVVKKHLVHDPEFYRSITRYQTWMGHIHTPDNRDGILMNGSFDRLAHGEEHPKGHWRCVTHPNGNYKATFVENKGAMIYKTIWLKNPDVDISMSEVKAGIEGLPKNSHVRIRADRGHPVIAGLETLRREYPHIHFKVKTDTEEEEKALDLAMVDDELNLGIEITPNNVIGLVDAKLSAMGVDPSLKKACLDTLREDIYGQRT